MNAFAGAVTGFVEGYTDGDPSRHAGDASTPIEDYGAIQPRRLRYDLHWSMYKNNTYRDIHHFARQYKAQFGLYRHTRGVYSPSKRLADFYRAHLMGGSLDPSAGDGSEIASALPIEGADDATRRTIARLWWDSNWEARKGVYTLWGTVLGDVFLAAVPDETLALMRMEVWHPGTISYLQRDPSGDVLAYQRRQTRSDPRTPRPDASGNVPGTRDVEFLEEASIENGKVITRTYLDRRPFDWRIDPRTGLPFGDGPNAKPEWVAAWDWIPLYHAQHIDEGLGWGASELEGGRAKIDEVNDLGSKLHDQVRRMVEGAWLFTGMVEPTEKPAAPRTPATKKNPEPGRQEMKTIYEQNANARPWSLVGDLDIAATSAEIRQALDSMEDDYPELRFERLRLGGSVSGEALRIARQPAAARVQERRPAYDYALVCCQMAAIAIGGSLRFDGYEGHSLASYSTRKPTHRIGRRPVFAVDPMDAIAEKAARFAALKVATEGGFPITLAMLDLGWSTTDVAEVDRLKAEATAALTPAPALPPAATGTPP